MGSMGKEAWVRNMTGDFRDVGRGHITKGLIGQTKEHGLYPEASEDQLQEGCDTVRTAF